MKILVTAATQFELNAISNRWREGSEKKHTIDLLVTGVGSVATAYNLTKALAQKQYSLVLNIGIAGSFSGEYPVGTVVAVTEECFADMGVYEDGGFKTIFDMRLMPPSSKPFINKWLRCLSTNTSPAVAGLPKVRAITVNTITGDNTKVAELKTLFNPDTESMEGAAFFYVCLCENVSFFQLRSISNMVGVRDKSKWNIPLALKNLEKAIDELLNLG